MTINALTDQMLQLAVNVVLEAAAAKHGRERFTLADASATRSICTILLDLPEASQLDVDTQTGIKPVMDAKPTTILKAVDAEINKPQPDADPKGEPQLAAAGAP